jgi:hypothetical protein
MTGGLNITLFSYNGSLDFGLIACREMVPDVWNLITYLQDALAEMVALVPGGSSGTRTAAGRTAAKTTPAKAPAKKAASQKPPAKTAAAKRTALRKTAANTTAAKKTPSKRP